MSHQQCFGCLHHVHSVSIWYVNLFSGREQYCDTLQNDDFYLSNPLTPRSFHTSGKVSQKSRQLRSHLCIVYGLVLRLDLGLLFGPEKPPPEEEHGEWRSNGESNFLLSQWLNSALDRTYRASVYRQASVSGPAHVHTYFTRPKASYSLSCKKLRLCGPTHLLLRPATRSVRPTRVRATSAYCSCRRTLSSSGGGKRCYGPGLWRSMALLVTSGTTRPPCTHGES